MSHTAHMIFICIEAAGGFCRVNIVRHNDDPHSLNLFVPISLMWASLGPYGPPWALMGAWVLTVRAPVSHICIYYIILCSTQCTFWPPLIGTEPYIYIYIYIYRVKYLLCFAAIAPQVVASADDASSNPLGFASCC